MVKDKITQLLNENPFEDQSLFWEYLKCVKRTETIAFSSQKAKQNKIRENEILNSLKQVEDEMHLTNDLSKRDECYKVKQEWEDMQTINHINHSGAH